MPVWFVKKHSVFGLPSKVEGVMLDGANKVEEIQDLLEMEDACWLALDERWVVLELNMKIRDMAPLLMGDGKTPDSAFEVKERVGGVVIDAASYVYAGVARMTSWMWPKQAIKKDPASQC